MIKAGIGTNVCADCRGRKKSLTSTRCGSCSNRITTKRRFEDISVRIKSGLAIKNSQKYQESKKSLEYLSKVSAAAKEQWKNPCHIKAMSEAMARRWEDPAWRSAVSKTMKDRWKDDTCRNKHLAARKKYFERPEAIDKISGPNSHLWRGGVSRKQYGRLFNRILKEHIRGRDGHLCQNCGANENGKLHDIHHIDFDKKNNDASNLITLCHSCHAKTNHGSKDYWKCYYSTRCCLEENGKHD